jgi:hypothetical protein
MSNPELLAMFPTVIYSVQLDNYEEINKLIVDKLPVHGFESYELITGEPEGKSLVHCDPDFQKFFEQVTYHAQQYMKIFKVKNELFDYFTTKSWYVIINRADHHIKYHMHSAGHISFSYYAEVPNLSDVLSFRDNNLANCAFDGLFDVKPYPDRNLITEITELNCKTYRMETRPGQLILFPSKLFHGTELHPENVNNVFPGRRLGIAGDINMLLRPEVWNFESGKLNWNHWRKF